jgi:hypothetical protein
MYARNDHACLTVHSWQHASIKEDNLTEGQTLWSVPGSQATVLARLQPVALRPELHLSCRRSRREGHGAWGPPALARERGVPASRRSRHTLHAAKQRTAGRKPYSATPAARRRRAPQGSRRSARRATLRAGRRCRAQARHGGSPAHAPCGG